MIRFWQYLDEYRENREEVLAVVDEVFQSGRLILGSRVTAFEQAFSTWCGARYGVGVNSGTDALFLALKALDIGNGDEVITVANTAVPTVAAIRAAGALPVFVDVEEDTFLMDVTRLEAAITARTKCILPVHLFGQTADMEPLLHIARSRSLRVVEDCAQATGALYRGKRAGSSGDIGAFSFYPTKVLGGYGDGGMAVTSDEGLKRKLKRLRFYGMDEDYYAEEEGYNSRLDEVQAALLHSKLPVVEEAVRKRQAIARRYDEGLSGVGDLVLPSIREGCSHQFYLYTIRSAFRDRLTEHLAERGIETRINYPVPIHLMRGYGFLGYREGDLPVTERLAKEILSLPIYPELPELETAQVIETVRAFFGAD